MPVAIQLTGEIGTDITAVSVKAALDAARGQPIVCRIHSEGGSVFEGFAIYNAIAEYRGLKTCVLDAAFSIASYLAMAFDRIEIVSNGYLMMHNPYADVSGDDTELTKHASLLAGLKAKMIDCYAKRSRQSPAKVAAMMASETFMDSTQAVAFGFANAIINGGSPVKIAAKYRTAINAKLRSQPGMTTKARWQAAVNASMTSGLTWTKAVWQVDKRYPGLRDQMVRDANKR